MDPSSALSICSSCVKLLDFTSQLISGSFEIYHPSDGGLDGDPNDLEIVRHRLVSIYNELQKSLRETFDYQITPNVQELRELCRTGSSISGEFILGLDRIKCIGKHNVYPSLRQALVSLWQQKRMNALEKTINGFKQQLLTNILVSIRYDNLYTSAFLHFITCGSLDMPQS